MILLRLECSCGSRKPATPRGAPGPGLCSLLHQRTAGATDPTLLFSALPRQPSRLTNPRQHELKVSHQSIIHLVFGAAGRGLTEGQHWAARLTFGFDFYTKSDEKTRRSHFSHEARMIRKGCILKTIFLGLPWWRSG